MGVKKLELSMLCDIYGSLLSEKQRDAVEMYCNEDYSLAEIAENTGISRQGVRDQIKHAESQLFAFEEKLKLMEKSRKASEMLAALSEKSAVKESPELLQLVKEVQDTLSFE
jgi:predicted DNA-binding protein YlxM (UPF0122 family)